MTTTAPSQGRTLVRALAFLSFAVLGVGTSPAGALGPASALEYEAVASQVKAPARASLNRSSGLYGSSDKWTIDLERTASYSFSETDAQENDLMYDPRATWLLGARVKISGNNLFFADDKLSLSVGVPLQTTSGRVTVLNNIFVRRKRDMRVRDLVLSLVNENLWSVAAAHQLPLAYKPLHFGYGVYAQFRGSELRHLGLGFSSRLKF